MDQDLNTNGGWHVWIDLSGPTQASKSKCRQMCIPSFKELQYIFLLIHLSECFLIECIFSVLADWCNNCVGVICYFCVLCSQRDCWMWISMLDLIIKCFYFLYVNPKREWLLWIWMNDIKLLKTKHENMHSISFFSQNIPNIWHNFCFESLTAYKISDFAHNFLTAGQTLNI